MTLSPARGRRSPGRVLKSPLALMRRGGIADAEQARAVSS